MVLCTASGLPAGVSVATSNKAEATRLKQAVCFSDVYLDPNEEQVTVTNCSLEASRESLVLLAVLYLFEEDKAH